MKYVIGNSKLGRRIASEVGAEIISRSKGAKYERGWFSKNLGDAEVVFFAAGKVSTDERMLREEHLKPLKELVSAVDCKILLASSISVYGKRVGVIRDGAPVAPDTPYARVKAEQEDLLKGREHAILRLGVLYGEEYEVYLKMLSLIDKGIAPVIGDGKNNVPFTYVGSVARFCRGWERLEGTYNVVGKGCKQIEALNIAAEELGKEPFYIHIPPGVGKVCDFLGCQFNSEAMLSLAADRKVSPGRAEEAGFKDIPIEEGIKKVVEAYERRKADGG